MSSNYGNAILEMFPEHSPIHEDGNPLRELIEYGIGKVLDDIELEIFNSSDMRFLTLATGIYLDLIGERYGICRNGKNDDDYRAILIAVKSSSPTIAGIKRTVSKILDIDVDAVIIIKGVEEGCRAGSIAADHYTGTPCHFVSHDILSKGVITIKIPSGSGADILELVLPNLVLSPVTVILKEYTAI
ncbi:hypothetical protein [Methanobacterium sp.]|uniref:hypothetical protein n=1 Tax=Methanobacterium sp. TaxID=2164 RepID=UPI003C78C558